MQLPSVSNVLEESATNTRYVVLAYRALTGYELLCSVALYKRRTRSLRRRSRSAASRQHQEVTILTTFH